MDATMKIAAVTDDGATISPHFGRARYYEVVSVENGKIVGRERRPKAGHHTFSGKEEQHGRQGQEDHDDQAHRDKHRLMSETISDCKFVLARGMGHGAYQWMTDSNIKPIVTDIRSIDEAVQAVIDGKIVDHTEKLH
jgi:predicted Fe-Mo cluster-binding NifX family protein